MCHPPSPLQSRTANPSLALLLTSQRPTFLSDMANPDLEPNALQKPPKGSVWLEGRARRKAITQREEANKLKVRKRDRICRWPHCENCRVHKPRLEVAHLTAKGMGGDHGIVSEPDQMILIDHLTHQSGPS